MPIQLDLGPYTITISTDGMNYRPDEDDPDQFVVTVERCPDGYTCIQEVKTICPPGYFCPHEEYQTFQPRQCPVGTYMTGTGASECDACSVDKFCPKIRLVVEEACPKGLLCPDIGSKTLREIQECPAGYYCPDDFRRFATDDLFANDNM